MAWEKWQCEAQEMKRQQMLLKRGLMRMIKAKLAQAWTKWRVEAANIKAEKEALDLAHNKAASRPHARSRARYHRHSYGARSPPGP